MLQLAAADLARLITNLGPTGDLWPTEPDAVQQQAYLALAGTFARLQARANYLVTDAFPSTTVELLPEWESTLGLPDPCAGPDATIAQRQAHVVARLTQSNGPSIPSLTAFAAALGYTITITETQPALADHACADDPDNDPEAAHVWQVNAAGVVTTDALADEAYADDPLETYGNAVLECEMRRLAPAHTIVVFAYSGLVPAAGWETAPGFDSGGWAP